MLGRAATRAGSLSSVAIPRPGHAVELAAGPELLMMMAPGSDLWTSTEKEGRRERGRRRAFACCAQDPGMHMSALGAATALGQLLISLTVTRPEHTQLSVRPPPSC